VLEGVEVLSLVDEEVAEPPVHERPEGLVGLDRAKVEVQQVVEVDDASASLQPFVRRRQFDEATGRNDAASTYGA
jgi:hypothetical protein